MAEQRLLPGYSTFVSEHDDESTLVAGYAAFVQGEAAGDPPEPPDNTTERERNRKGTRTIYS